MKPPPRWPDTPGGWGIRAVVGSARTSRTTARMSSATRVSSLSDSTAAWAAAGHDRHPAQRHPGQRPALRRPQPPLTPRHSDGPGHGPPPRSPGSALLRWRVPKAYRPPLRRIRCSWAGCAGVYIGGCGYVAVRRWNVRILGLRITPSRISIARLMVWSRSQAAGPFITVRRCGISASLISQVAEFHR